MPSWSMTMCSSTVVQTHSKSTHKLTHRTQEIIILHHSYAQFETEQAKKLFDWIAAARNAYRRVRVIGHHCGYDGSFDSIRSNHALIHWLTEYWGKVIHVLGRDKNTLSVALTL